MPHHLLSIVVQASISYIYAHHHHHHHHGARITNARTKNYYYYYIIKKTSCKFLRVYAEVKRTCNNFKTWFLDT